MDITSHCSGRIESGMFVSSRYGSFCHIEVYGVILTCKSSSLGSICDGRSVICHYSCDYDMSGSVISCGDEVPLMGEFSLDTPG